MEWECCWVSNEIGSEDCPYIAPGEEELYTSFKRRVIDKCLECPRFRSDLQKFRETGHPLGDVLPHVVDEFNDQKTRLLSMGSFLSSKTTEIRFLHELNVVLQTSVDLDEILSIAMTAITSGKGFGMNRAFLLMADKDRKFLKGYLGVGPMNYEEAWQIWREIGEHDLTLHDMARNFQRNKLASEKIKFHDILEKLTVPLLPDNHIFNRVLHGKKPLLIIDAFHNPDADQELALLLGVDSFLIMPLISRNRRIGLIIADNCITHKTITPHDLQLMETFAFPVAFALERASLYERLQEEVDKLTLANMKLQEQQELIVKMEKMAVVGQITSSIAHSIRNPLMIIGGFARSLVKTIPENDRNRDHLESIVREAKQLEDVLDEVLGYADSLYPATDTWDINQIVTGVFGKMKERLDLEKIGFSLALAASLPLAVIDYKQIVFCVRTILNALIELPDVNAISVATRQIDNRIELEIRGNGSASSPESRSAAAESDSTFAEMEDTLGLPLCKAILEKNRAGLLIDEPGKWTSYTIRLHHLKGDD